MKYIVEKTISDEHRNSLWMTGAGKNDFELGEDGKFKFKGRISFDNATVQNPLFFTKNLMYAYSYANGNKDGYIALVKIKNQRELNVLDLTDSNELAQIFPACADSPCFYEIFNKAEPYFGFNCGDIAQGKQHLRPKPFIIARLVISYRNQDKLGPFIDAYKAFEDQLQPYVKKKSDKDDICSTITKCYPAISPDIIKKRTLNLDQLIMDDRLKNVNFYDKKFTEDEYTEVYNAYCEAVFKHCIILDDKGEYAKDDSGKYVLAKYGDMFPQDTRKNINRNRPVSRDKTIGLTKGQKNINITLPEKMSSDDIKMVNLYLSISEEIHRWYKDSVANENTTLSKKFEQITSIINNNDGQKNINTKVKKNGNFAFDHGMAASYIDRLQYMLFYLVSKNSRSYDGCYSPEVLGSKSNGKNIDSVDETILIWNSASLEIVDVVKCSSFQDIKYKIDAASANDDKESNYYFKGRKYTDDDIRSLFDEAKLSNDSNDLRHGIQLSGDNQQISVPKTINSDEYVARMNKAVHSVVNDKQLSIDEKGKKLSNLRRNVYYMMRYRKKTDASSSTQKELRRLRDHITKILHDKCGHKEMTIYNRKEDLISKAVKIKLNDSFTLDEKIKRVSKLIRMIDIARHYNSHSIDIVDRKNKMAQKTINVMLEAYPHVRNIRNELYLEKSIGDLREKIETLKIDKSNSNKNSVKKACEKVEKCIDLVVKSGLSDSDTVKTYKRMYDDMMVDAKRELQDFSEYVDTNAKYMRTIDSILNDNDSTQSKINRIEKYAGKIRVHKSKAVKDGNVEEVQKTQKTLDYVKEKKKELKDSIR